MKNTKRVSTVDTRQMVRCGRDYDFLTNGKNELNSRDCFPAHAIGICGIRLIGACGDDCAGSQEEL